MNLYHVWFDLKPGASDLVLSENLRAFLEPLRSEGVLDSWRCTRRKLGLGPATLGEFHVWMEFRDLAALDRAFEKAASRRNPVESLHFAVNRWVTHFQAALYRDFPDEVRHHGDERF